MVGGGLCWLQFSIKKSTSEATDSCEQICQFKQVLFDCAAIISILMNLYQLISVTHAALTTVHIHMVPNYKSLQIHKNYHKKN